MSKERGRAITGIAGGVGVRADAVLCLLLDGSTSGPTSGDLARQISLQNRRHRTISHTADARQILGKERRHIHASAIRPFPMRSPEHTQPIRHVSLTSWRNTCLYEKARSSLLEANGQLKKEPRPGAGALDPPL